MHTFYSNIVKTSMFAYLYGFYSGENSLEGHDPMGRQESVPNLIKSISTFIRVPILTDHKLYMFTHIVT